MLALIEVNKRRPLKKGKIMIVTDLSNSFNPCPKNTIKKEKVKTRIKQKSNKLAKKEKEKCI